MSNHIKPDLPIAVVCNPSSGKGKALTVCKQLEHYLSSQHISYTTFQQQLPQHINNFSRVIILGGDGTINFTINHFKQISIPIALIPCGTGNDIATFLLGKQTMEQYMYTAVFGEAQPIDAGMCNNTLFLNGAGIGFDGWVVKKLLAKKLFSGKAAYYSTVISLLLFYKEQRCKITVDHQNYELPLFMLCAANGKTYGGGFNVAPYAAFNDGLLESVCISRINLWKRLTYLPVIEKGNHLKEALPFVHYQTAKQITIQFKKNVPAHLDGEYMEASTFNIQILPHYFRICL
ncbi:MAG: diacylglycerol/lipid kinase family protein [Bacteroidota bacterium]